MPHTSLMLLRLPRASAAEMVTHVCRGCLACSGPCVRLFSEAMALWFPTDEKGNSPAFIPLAKTAPVQLLLTCYSHCSCFLTISLHRRCFDRASTSAGCCIFDVWREAEPHRCQGVVVHVTLVPVFFFCGVYSLVLQGEIGLSHWQLHCT